MSRTAEYDDRNIFAKMLRGEMPYVGIFEDDAVLSFMDIFPQSRGHTLVIPKAVEATDLLGMEEKQAGRLAERVHRVARAVDRALEPDGVVITQFNREPAGQTVFHPHFHIIPRYSDANFSAHAAGQKADPAELEQLAERIRAAL